MCLILTLSHVLLYRSTRFASYKSLVKLLCQILPRRPILSRGIGLGLLYAHKLCPCSPRRTLRSESDRVRPLRTML